ncbi:methanol dehydrogenase [Sphingomonas sp. Leaf33]|uniref:TPM domain-containing protein n=1 Tax=Sphingomonas sp. Leaf33 TaxID=1736215 RepID=UPI0006F4F7B2|nr:TPM domain-containing protein [Sphingomonas sp. Leaf33]KQN24755.1 methanol dehydrogenase [Sphingomonas sp. Leaf33]
MALLLAVVAIAPAAAQTFPKFTGFVVDDANVLPPDVEASLTQKLDRLQKDTKRQLVVATIGDMQGYPLDEYGYKLGRAWGVGLKDANNGAILFIAPNNPAGQRGPRLEVGYGLEPILTDALSSQIINQQMMPRLRDGQIPQAMEAGTDAIVAQLRASPEEQQAKVDAAVKQFDKSRTGQRRSGGGGFPISLIFWGMVVVFVLLSFARRGKGRRYRGDGGSGALPIVLWSIANEIGREAGRGSGSGWGGGSGGGGGWGGGGFSGGGGGSFGGGGASGSW